MAALWTLALADLQRWRRVLRRQDGGVEPAVAVPSQTGVGKREVHASLGIPQLHCSGDGNGVWLGAAGGGCLLFSRG